MIGRFIFPPSLFVLLALAAAVALPVGCGPTEPPLPAAPIAAPPAAPAAPPNTPPVATGTILPSAPTPHGSAPGGSPPHKVEVLVIGIAPLMRDIPDYDRGDWRHWIDADRDCQDARQEALIAESLSPVVYRDSDECRVRSGEWFGAYTGESFTNPSDLDLDHMVPLANAHRSGGWAWSDERKREYANSLAYPNHLIAVKASANRQKSDKGPEEWKPPRREYWCQYAIDWTTIKETWGLTATQREANALQEMLATCEEPISLVGAIGGPPQPPQAQPPAASTATPMPPPDGELRYDPDGPDRDCGDFDTWDEAQAFYLAAGGPDDDRHRLDRDGDGVACASLRGN